MAYVKLHLPDTILDSISIVIREGVEPLLQDIHWMLATVIAEPADTGPRRQLQVPIAHVLLATVAGVSAKLLYAPGRKNGERFRECLTRFFPWDIDPAAGVSNEEAAKILYEVFRNPLVHRLGLSKARTPVVKIGQVFRGTDDAEDRVEEIERLTAKPYSKPCLVVTPERRVLWLTRSIGAFESSSSDGPAMRFRFRTQIRDSRHIANSDNPVSRLGGEAVRLLLRFTNLPDRRFGG